jgi:hypothetical protein
MLPPFSRRNRRKCPENPRTNSTRATAESDHRSARPVKNSGSPSPTTTRTPQNSVSAHWEIVLTPERPLPG